VRESAVSAKRVCIMFGAKPAQPETPSEPRPSGAHPEEAQWSEDTKPPRLGLEGELSKFLKVIRCGKARVRKVEVS